MGLTKHFHVCRGVVAPSKGSKRDTTCVLLEPTEQSWLVDDSEGPGVGSPRHVTCISPERPET